MSLLTIIQNVCAEINIDVPSAVMSSADPQIVQLRILSFRAGYELARDHDWSVLVVRRSFTTTGTTPEPAEPPPDWQRFIDNGVIWNNSRLWQMNGPVDTQTWQRNTVINTNPVPQLWRMLGGKLAIYPNTAGETASYEYVSENWVNVNGGGTSFANNWANDSDTARFTERLIELSLIWRWKRVKGLDYGEEMANFERAKESEIGSDRASSAVSLSMPNRGELPNNYWPGQIAVPTP